MLGIILIIIINGFDFVLIEEKKLLDTKRDVGELQRKVSSLKKELKTEVRKSRITDRDVSDF